MSTPEPIAEPPIERPVGIRWWPAGVVFAASAVGWIYIWNFQDVDRQSKNLRTLLLILATSVLLLLWVLLLSRMRWTRRFLALGGVAAVVGALTAMLEIRGVTGDMLPVLAWRWSKPSSQILKADAPVEDSQRAPLAAQSLHDYPQMLGPERSGELPGPRLSRDWQAEPPELVWRQPIGGGWSGFAIAGEHAVTMEQRGDSELVVCYRLLTGELIWTHVEDSFFQSVIAGDGPRSVPTIVDGRVFAVGANGILCCLQLIDGALLWSRDIVTENEASIPSWGISCSPLVVDGKVIVCAGGDQGRSLIAYDVQTGEQVWSGGDDRAGYSSPVLATIDGAQQILMFNNSGVKSHDLATGAVLWGYDWKRGHPHIVMPVATPDGRVLISSGYGTGSQLIRASLNAAGEWAPTKIWESRRLKSKFANVIVRAGYVYGLDDGIFVCLDLDTGDLQWKRGRYGHGQMILVDDLLLVMAESGDVVLLEPNPAEHRELTRFTALDGKTWNPPALAGVHLLVRNDSEAACYRLPVE